MALPRWIEMYTNSSGVGLSSYLNAGHTHDYMYGRGTPAALRGDTPTNIPISLTSSEADLMITMNDGSSASSKTFTLASGNNLDPRVIARDITDKMHREYPVNHPIWTQAYCLWWYNAFEIRSGICGHNASVAVDYTANSAASKLGFTHGVTAYGSDNDRLYGGGVAAGNKTTNTWSGSITVSGTSFAGSWDEYTIVAVNSDAGEGQGTAAITTHASGTYPGTVTLGGVYNYTDGSTYHIQVTVSGSASYMNGVKDAVPRMTWYGTGGDTTMSGVDSGYIELLYPNHPYPLGNKGLWVKFSNAPFSYPGDSWQISASGIVTPEGYDYQWGSAMRKVIWSSIKGDTQWTQQSTATFGNYFRVGRKGIFMTANQDYNVAPGDTIRIRMPGPIPYRYDVTSVNLGNITVTTSSRVFCMRFDLYGGATELTNVKFSLLNNGGMGYHDGVNTAFRWGTVGPGQKATSTDYDVEWWNQVVTQDLVTPKPSYLYAIDSNLTVVSTADDSKTIGIDPFDALISDYIFCAIQLGADESGQKTVIYRCYYDYTE
jgi:hypothetical protein